MTVDIDAVKNSVKDALEKLYCNYSVDDEGEIYVSSKIEFPVWVSVLDNGFLKIFTYVAFKEGTSDESAWKLSNALNENLLPNSVYALNGRLCSTYYLPITDGFSERHFVDMLFRCAGSFKQGFSTLDVDDVLA